MEENERAPHSTRRSGESPPPQARLVTVVSSPINLFTVLFIFSRSIGPPTLADSRGCDPVRAPPCFRLCWSPHAPAFWQHYTGIVARGAGFATIMVPVSPLLPPCFTLGPYQLSAALRILTDRPAFARILLQPTFCFGLLACYGCNAGNSVRRSFRLPALSPDGVMALRQRLESCFKEALPVTRRHGVLALMTHRTS